MKPVFPALLCLTALVTACASPPTRYYSLLDTPTAERPALVRPAPDAAGLRLQVLQVPAEADRLQLVVRVPAQDPAVQVLNDSVWAAPLVDQVGGVLAAAVAARLGVPDLRRLSDAQARPARRIDVRLNRFDLIWGEAAELAATWTDQAAGAKTARVCQGRVRLSVKGPGVAGLVEAQRRALLRLADLIAAADGAAIPPVPNEVSAYGCT